MERKLEEKAAEREDAARQLNGAKIDSVLVGAVKEAAEAKAVLQRLGGASGIALKLCSNTDTGITPHDTIERVEA